LDGGPVAALFENRTGDKNLDSVAMMATTALTTGLSLSGGWIVRQNPDIATGGPPARTPSSTATPDETLRALAARTEAGLVVTGAIFPAGDKVRFESRLLDVTAGSWTPLKPVEGPRQDPTAAIAALGDQLAATVAAQLRRDIRPGRMHVPPAAAYEEWQRGMETWGVDWDASVGHLERALEIDPEWLNVRLWICLCHTNRNMNVQAERQVSLLEQQSAKLNAFDRLGVKCLRAVLAGRWRDAVDARREQDRLAPGLPWVRFDVGLFAFYANQPQLAVDTLAQLPYVMAGAPAPNAWRIMAVCDALHVLGRYKEELDAAAKGRQEFPSMIGFYARQARALVGLGRLTDVTRILDEALSTPYASAPPVGVELTLFDQCDAGQVLCLVSMDLQAHGHAPEALATARRAVGWFEARPASEKRALSSRWLLALAKYLAEDWEGARVLYEPLANLARPVRPPGWSEEGAFLLTVRFRGRLGVIAARRGDRAAAQRIAKDLEQVDHPYLYGEHWYQRAAIAAQLGERDGAVALLREAIAQGFTDVAGYAEYFHRAPEMAPLRGYAPFEALIKPKGSEGITVPRPW
jgi:tetratricopeptide (TPR) repeat protein